MDSKPPVQPAKALRRKVHVVYYLSRGGGQMDHPHLLEGYLSAAQDGLRLRDFKRWLAVLRGKSMASTFAWSYKRTYKNGFIWHDLGDNDMIQPLSKNEYVLMGSEIKELGVLGKCKCGGVQQQTETKVAAELGDIQEEPLNKSVLRSPKLVSKSSLVNIEDDQKIDMRVTQIRSNSGRLLTAENIAYDNKLISKSGMQYRGGSSRSFNELTAQRLLEEVKRPTNYQDTNKHSGSKSFNQSRSINTRALIQDSEHSTEDLEEIVEPNSNDEVQGDFHEARREIKKANSNSPYRTKQAASTPKSRRDYNMDGNHEDMIGVMSDSHDNDDDVNGTYIMDAATQTGDSTRCSTDHQDGTAIPARYNNMLELMDSPGASAKYSGAHGYVNAAGTDHTIRRVNSARFNKSHHAGSGVIRGNVSRQLSKEFSNLPDLEKAMMINQTSELVENSKAANVSSSNNTSLLNHMGSPALSACSTRSTRFAREDNNRSSSAAVAKSSSKKYISKSDSHHTHHKGSSHSSSPNTTSSASHSLLKQLLTCGNADVVTESKPSDHVIMSNNALSGLQTPSRMISANAYQGRLVNSHDKNGSNSNNNMWACKPGLTRRISTASSDNKSVISATVSDQASIRDTLEMISSPESVYNNRHLKSHIIKANGANAAAAATGSTSPGMLSVGSSMSRRSSMRECDMNIVGGDNVVEEGFREALRSHHVGVGVSPKTRVNKGNKNTILIHDILDNEVSHDCRNSIEPNSIPSGAKTNSTTVRELHKLICNPSGTPTCSNNHNKVTSSNFATMPHVHNTTRDSYTPQHHQSHHILIATHGPSRTPTRSSNLNSPNLVVLSKSLNSPSASMFLEEVSHPPPSASSYISSWKDLLWSPRYNSSHKEKEKRHMKP